MSKNARNGARYMTVAIRITRLPHSSGAARSSMALVREIDGQETTIGILQNRAYYGLIVIILYLDCQLSPGDTSGTIAVAKPDIAARRSR